MTFHTPRNLNNLAARAFVEDLILNSRLMSRFNEISRYDTENLYETLNFDHELKILKVTVNDVSTIMKNILRGCSGRNIESIQQVLRTTDHRCSSGVLILQFLYDKEINLRKKHWDVFPIFVQLQNKYKNVEKLTLEHIGCLDIYPDPAEVYGRCLRCLPNLKVFKAMIRPENKCLTSLRKHCRDLRELSLIIKGGSFPSSQLSSLFFCGKELKLVKEAYVKLEDIPLTFPHLKSFSINHIGQHQFDFFKMFIHYYPDVNFPIGLNYDYFNCSSVSWFDAVLSHSVIINPELSIKQCDLNIHDLFLPFCEKSLIHWKRLETLYISVGPHGKKAPATPTTIGKRLESLLSKQNNIKDFWIRINGPVSEDELSAIFHPSLRSHGSNFRQFGIIGILHFIGHRSLVNIVNFCTNIKQLVLIGKRINKYLKDTKLKTFKNLEHLTIIWDEKQVNNAVCQWISKVTMDFIKNSPNLKVLNCTANISLLESLQKIKLESDLWKIVLNFHIEKSCDVRDYLYKILPGLPKLQELVVNYNEGEYDIFEEGSSCINDPNDEIYTAVSQYVRHTQIQTRYFTIEDNEIKWML